MSHVLKLKDLQQRRKRVLEEIAKLTNELRRLDDEISGQTMALDAWAADSVLIEETRQEKKPLIPKMFQSQEYTNKGKIILVVDDSLMMRMLLKKLLVNKGYKVYEAADGAEALYHLNNNEVHLVITEISLPNISGHELVEKLRSNVLFAQLPVIICTTQAEKTEILRTMNLGVQGFIVKPIEREVLYERVSMALNRKS